jgi:Tfp pilus assembly protein PilO
MDIQISKGIGKIQTGVPMKKSTVSTAEIIGLLILIGLFYWFIFQPKSSAVNAQQVVLEELQAQEKDSAENLQKLQNLVRDLQKYSKEVELLDEALPLNGKVVNLHLLMSSMAASSGVTVGDINFSSRGDEIVAGNREVLANPYAADRTLNTITGSVYVSGSFLQLKSFLEKVEQSGRIIDILSVDISGTTRDQLDLRLAVTTYYYE